MLPNPYTIKNAPKRLLAAALKVESGEDDGSKFDAALEMYVAKKKDKLLLEFLDESSRIDASFFPFVQNSNIVLCYIHNIAKKQ